MNIINLAFKNIQHKPLHSILTILAMTMGGTILMAAYLVSTGISDGFKRNAAGIDIVAGAKGSPLQLILSTVYHADVPTGNINVSELKKIQKNPMVKEAIPLVVGDNYKGFRVVGSTSDFLQLYKADVAEGVIFSQTFDVVAGASTGLKLGEEFAAHHGFAADSDDVHDDHLYKVVGVLKPTGTTIDRLLITNYQAVQQLHGHHEHGHDDNHAHHDHDEDDEDMEHQITAVLIKISNRAALMNLPRMINQQEHIQASSPAYELARLTKNFGVGRDAMTILGLSLLGLSTFMIFAMLASSLVERRKDMAVLRVMGASPSILFSTLMMEGIIIAVIGTALGIISGHILAYSLTGLLGSFEGILLRKELISFHGFDALIFIIGCCAGVLAALPAAISAARTDIAKLLAKG